MHTYLTRSKPLRALFLAICFLGGGLGLSRILFEWLFPRGQWLGQPIPVLALIGGSLLLTLWYWSTHEAMLPAHTASPLLLNFLFLNRPDVDLISSRLLSGAGIWLFTLLLLLQREEPRARWRWPFAWLAAGTAAVYFLTLGRTVGAADTFEFQVVVPKLGIVHPTGYPLYLLLGRLWLLIPLGSAAWRLNFATAAYGVSAVALLYLLSLICLPRQNGAIWPSAFVAAAAFALRPPFWSQAVAAEVYTLHNLIVVLILLLTLRQLHPNGFNPKAFVGLAALIGVGLTNHLTTVFLLPPTAVAFVLAQRRSGRPFWRDFVAVAPQLALAAVLPLTLYAYLPLRWQAVNGEPMGVGRFMDWVIGGRFQAALQWDAWLNDPTRYAIVGRLFLATWTWWGLALAAVGLVYLAVRNWQAALLLLLTWLGFTFYCLNYYVPDLSVFLLPAQLVTAVWLAVGIHALITAVRLPPVAALLLFVPILFTAAADWASVDQSSKGELARWGRGVLTQPLKPGSLILADSEKIAPLYYLQQAEGLRPDLDIQVLPDEAAYQAALDTAVANGRTVYLARFLPGLAGLYHLRAAGPLTEVSTAALTEIPTTAERLDLQFGLLRLRGYELEQEAAVAAGHAAVTLYWQAQTPSAEPLHIYVRWAGERPLNPAGQHPANNNYPTVAWEAGEVVTDFYLIPYPPQGAGPFDLQVAVAPPFTPSAELAWRSVTQVTPGEERMPTAVALRPVRAQLGSSVLTAAAFPSQVRPNVGNVPLWLVGEETAALEFAFIDAAGKEGPWEPELRLADDEGGMVAVRRAGETAVCGWFRRPTRYCELGEIRVNGVAVPEGATNFGDRIALLDVMLTDPKLIPGGELTLSLRWQSLAPMSENYTIFVQVLDGQDKIVGQVDAWPLQGTYPTSAWQVGEIITDPYRVPLAADLAPGNYRLIVGFYRLADLQRLPVLDAAGSPLDDKFTLTGLMGPE